MNRKILCIIFAIMMMFPICVKASSCGYNEQARLRKVSTNVVPSYTYTENGDDVSFTVTLTNLNSDLYIVDNTSGIRYDYNGNSEISISGYKPGANIRYTIYTTKTDCFDAITYLTIKYVNLPYYNKYYKDSLCVGMESYSICSKWQPVSYNYDEFKTKINWYKEEAKEEEESNSTVDNSKNVFDYIFEFISKYYVYMIAVFTLVFLLVTFVKNKKNQFNL